MPATWATDCSVCWNPSRPWTAAWTGRLPVTRMPCAPTCTSRVGFPAPSPQPCLTRRWPADRASLPSAEKRAGVFHLQAPSGPYGLNFSEAEAACGAQGAVLASLLQLSAAQQVCGAWESGAKPVGALFSWALGLSLCFVLLQLGLHLCLVGWLANGSAAHPVVFPAADCGDGQVGVVSLGARENRSERWDAYCFRMRGAAAPHPAHGSASARWPAHSLRCPSCRRGLPVPRWLRGRRDKRVQREAARCAGHHCQLLHLLWGTQGPGRGVAGVLMEGTHPQHCPTISRCYWVTPMPPRGVLSFWTSWMTSTPTRHSSSLSTKVLSITW